MRELVIRAILGLNKEELDFNMLYYYEYLGLLSGVDYQIYKKDKCFRFCYSRKHMK